jgi:hypothetical protein
LSKTTVQHVTKLDVAVDSIKTRITVYNAALTTRLNDNNFQLDITDENEFFSLDTDNMYDETVVPAPKNVHTIDVDDVRPDDDPTKDAYNTLLNAEVMVSVGDEQLLGTVTKRAKGPDGLPIGTRSEQPARDTHLYEVRLPDRSLRELTHNLIAENLFSQCDTEGGQYQIIKEISDHQSNATVMAKGDK